MSKLANITIESAVSETWDAVVIGAGPSGALAARQLVASKARVLLVERKSFPRYKVCGACVNSRAIRTLELAGMADLISALPTRPLHRLRMYQRELQSDLKLSGSVAVSRSRFDLELVKRAIQDGVCFLDETNATVEPASTGDFRYLRLQSAVRDDDRLPLVESRVILAADGLTGSSLRDCELETEIREDSRVGFGGSVTDTRQRYQPYTIHMAIHARGYVGLVQVENDVLNIAGAADAEFLKECGGPAQCANEVIRSSGLPPINEVPANNKVLPNDSNSRSGTATWVGTPALTRRRSRAADHRLLLLGDATGYVEPFTGEGIAWALTSACQAAPLAIEGITDWNANIESRWQVLRDQHAARQQRTCRGIAKLLRRPALVRMSMQAVATFPGLATPFLRRMNQPAI